MKFHEKYRGWIIATYWTWFIVLFVAAIWDENWNPVFGFVTWFLFLCFIAFDEKVAARTRNNRFGKLIYHFFDLDDFVRTGWATLTWWTIPLFIVGNGLIGSSNNVISVSSPYTTRLVMQNQLALHVPVLENTNTWRVTQHYKVYVNNIQLETVDGSHLSLDLNADFLFYENPRILEFAEKYGGTTSFKEQVELEITRQVQKLVEQITLEEFVNMPQLLFQDLIVSSLDLSMFDLKLAGVVEVTNIQTLGSQ